MRSAVSELEVVRPRRLADALAALGAAAREGSPLVPLAGGTDLYVYLNAGQLQARRFLDLWGLAELRRIGRTDGGTEIGALATFTRIAADRDLARRWPILREAALQIGGRQIQNRATLGGNVANASPAGDSLPVLLAAGASIDLASSEGTRSVPYEDLHTGYRASVRRPDEILTRITLPDPPPRSRQFFRKVGTRRAQAISKIVLAGVVARDTKGVVTSARIGIGSVAEIPLRARAAEAALVGSKLDAHAIAAATEALRGEIRPIDDVRSTADYRRTVAGNVLRACLEDIA